MVGGNDVGTAVGANEVGTGVGEYVGAYDGDAVGATLIFLVGREVGWMEGCVLGCPVGLAQRGNTFMHAFLQSVYFVFRYGAAPTKPGFVTELKVNEVFAFDTIAYDAPAAGAGP